MQNALTDFDRRTEFGNMEANLRFLDMIGLVYHARRALEVGTGTGGMLQRLLDRGVPVCGVEIREDSIKKGEDLYGKLPIQRVEGTVLPFKDDSFDVVMSFDVFEHIPDSDAHLREVSRVLEPGGSYVMQTPNKWTNTVFETIRWRSFTKWRIEHCSLHTKRELTQRLNRHGFDVTFYDVPVVTDFMRRKIKRFLGNFGLLMLRLIPIDRLPLGLRPSLFVVATKRT